MTFIFYIPVLWDLYNGKHRRQSFRIGRRANGYRSKTNYSNRKFEDLNLDSVAIVELVFSLEETFDISIPFEGLDESEIKKHFYNVSSLADHIKDLLQKNA